MNTKFEILIGAFPALAIEELKAIKGGLGIPLSTDDLQKMFDYSALGGFDSNLAKIFNRSIDFIAQTDIGSNMLQQLLVKAKSDPLAQIALTNDNQRTAAFAYYTYDNNTHKSYIDIENLALIASNEIADLAAGVKYVTHELFHAHESIIKNDHTNNIDREVDAHLMSAMVGIQLDVLKEMDNFYRLGIGSTVTTGDPDTTPAAIKVFNNAFDDIIVYQDFSISNYNKLLANFKATVFNNYGNGSYTQMGDQQITDFHSQTVEIYSLFNQSYLQQTSDGTGSSGSSYPSGNDGNNGSGYGGGGYGGGGYDGDGGSGYSPQPPNNYFPPNRDTYHNGPGGGTTEYGGGGWLPPGYYESNDSSSW